MNYTLYTVQILFKKNISTQLLHQRLIDDVIVVQLQGSMCRTRMRLLSATLHLTLPCCGGYGHKKCKKPPLELTCGLSIHGYCTNTVELILR